LSLILLSGCATYQPKAEDYNIKPSGFVILKDGQKWPFYDLEYKCKSGEIKDYRLMNLPRLLAYIDMNQTPPLIVIPTRTGRYNDFLINDRSEYHEFEGHLCGTITPNHKKAQV